jgi:arylsulfatase A-like enzyme
MTMVRTPWIPWSLPLCLAILAGCAAPATPPNVLLILTDDEPVGYTHLLPQIRDRIFRDGVTFHGGVVTTSLCCPSRASILSGAYATTHGITRLGGAPVFDAGDTIATRLHDAGYTTALIGKYLNDNGKLAPRIPPGWDEWQTFADVPLSFLDRDQLYSTFRLNENGRIAKYSGEYSTDLLAERSVAFLEAADEPFFLYFAPFAPHVPPMPAPRHAGAFAEVEPTPGPAYLEADTSDKPEIVRQGREWLEGTPTLLANLRRPDDLRGRLESLLAVDEAVGRFLDVLDRRGLTERTLVIYLSDNGYMEGQHWLWAKTWMYEDSIRVPFAMRMPSRIPAGLDVTAVVANIDIAPTIAEVTGVAPPAGSEGTSLRPLWADPSAWHRDGVRLEFVDAPRGERSTLVGFRMEDWKYVEWSTGEEELYHLAEDPHELENLAGREPAHPMLGVLRARIADAPRSIDPGRWTPHAATARDGTDE